MGETIEYKGHTIRIEQEEYPCNPLEEFDIASQFFFFHRRYNLGSKDNPYSENIHWWGDLRLAIVKDYQPVAIFSVSMLDHGGLWIRRGFNVWPEDPGGWDSGLIGFAFISRETVLKEYGCKRVGKRIREKATKLLEAEFRIYQQYVEGDVWGYIVEGPAISDDETSCWGFYGYDYCLEAAKGIVDWCLENNPEWLALHEAPVGPMEAIYADQ